MSLKQGSLSVALLLVCAIAGAAQPAQLTTKYDKFNDTTLVQMEPLRVMGEGLEGISLNLGYVCEGDVKFCKPAAVFLGVSVALKGTAYPRPGNLTILADGERFPIGDMKRIGIDTLPRANIVVTTFGTLLPYENYVKIAKSKRIEMRLDVTEFELSDHHRSDLSGFAILMYPAARP